MLFPHFFGQQWLLSWSTCHQTVHHSPFHTADVEAWTTYSFSCVVLRSVKDDCLFRRLSRIKYLSCAALIFRRRPLALFLDLFPVLFNFFSSRTTVDCEQFILFAKERGDIISLSNATSTLFLRCVSWMYFDLLKRLSPDRIWMRRTFNRFFYAVRRMMQSYAIACIMY